MFPCGVCQLAVTWSQKTVACDACSVWLHISCASIGSTSYDQLENMSWKCYCCGSRNISSFVLNAYNLNISNSFATLAGIPVDDSVFLHEIASPPEQFAPGFHSSPMSDYHSKTSHATSTSSRNSHNSSSISVASHNNIRLTVVNANGIRAELAELSNSTQADVMVITETKLDNTKSPSEFLPKNYEVPAHRDHSSHGGGVLIATKRGIVADEVPLKASENGKIVCTKIAIAKASPLYICAFYRPPSDPTDSLSNLESALEELAELTKNSPKSSVNTVIGAGEFNARDFDWKMLVPTQECKKKGLCNDLITMLGEAGLHQMQRECHGRMQSLTSFASIIPLPSKPSIPFLVSLTIMESYWSTCTSKRR